MCVRRCLFSVPNAKEKKGVVSKSIHGILNRWNLHCTNCAKIPLNKGFEIHATLRNFIKRNFTTIGTVQIPMVETSMIELCRLTV